MQTQSSHSNTTLHYQPNLITYLFSVPRADYCPLSTKPTLALYDVFLELMY